MDKGHLRCQLQGFHDITKVTRSLTLLGVKHGGMSDTAGVLGAGVAALTFQRSVLQMAPSSAYICRMVLLASRSADVFTLSYICDAGPAARYGRRYAEP